MTMDSKRLWVLTMWIVLLAPAGWAQRIEPVGPHLPIADEQESSSKPSDEPQPEPEPDQADNGPLGGAESFSLGGLLEGRKYYRYSVNAAQRVGFDTGSGRFDARGTTSLNGTFELRRALPRSETTLTYRGGVVSRNELGTAQSFHALMARQYWRKGRWNLLVGNQLLYTPESPYSMSVAGQVLNFAFTFNGQTTTNSIFIPGQHILSGETARLGNSTFGQVQYRLGPRTSVFGAGGYAFLKFTNPQLNDFSQPSAVVGLDHRLSGSDTIGVNYNFSQYRFALPDSNISTHSVHLTYGRQLGSRMALTVSAGPQLRSFRDLQLGRVQRLSWSAGGGLRYNLRSSQLGFNYHHSVNGGSGVQTGSEGDSIYLSWDRPLMRRWNMGVMAGYSRNTALRPSSSSGLRPTFDTTYGSVVLSRNLGSDKRMYFSYYLTHQLRNGGDGFPLRHGVEVGLSWNPRAHSID